MGILSWLENPRSDSGITVATEGGGWVEYSYAEIARRARVFAKVLSAFGIHGKIVSIAVADGALFPVAFFATWLAGAVPNPIQPPRRSSVRGGAAYVDHVAGLLSTVRPALVIAEDGNEYPVRAAAQAAALSVPILTTPALTALDVEAAEQLDGRDRRPPPECALLQLTSGSSGRPRPMQISLSNLEANIAALRKSLAVTPDCGAVTWLPFHHDMGLIGMLLTSFVNTGRLWIMRPEQYLRRPLTYLRLLGNGAATITAGPTFGYGHLAMHVSPEELEGLDFTTWRTAIVGAERIDMAVLGAVYELLRPHGFRRETFLPAYGLAEATLVVTCGAVARPARAVRLGMSRLVPGSSISLLDEAVLGDPRMGDDGNWIAGCGSVVSQTQVEVVDQKRQPVAPGVLGEVSIQGESVAVATLASVPGADDEVPGRLYTGDAGFLWDGELFVLGRMGDSINVRGRVVFVEDLEARLIGVPGLMPGRFAVVAGYGASTGLVLVIAETTESTWAAAAARRLRGELGSSVAIKVLVGRRGAIARTSSGKPRRRLMWQSYHGGPHTLTEVLHWRGYTTGRAALTPGDGGIPESDLVAERGA